MKYLLLFTILVSASVHAKAVSSDHSDGCPTCIKKDPYGDPSVDGQLALMGKMREKVEEGGQTEYEALGVSLCNTYSTNGDIVKEMKNTIRDTMGKVEVPPNPNPTDREIFEFLNKHTDKLTCWGKHYLAVAFDKGVYMTVYKEFLKVDSDDPDAYKVNFNSVTMTLNPHTGEEEPMTILDYIQKVALKDSSISNSTTATKNVKYIRKMIRRPKYDAKFYKEIQIANES